MTAHTSLLQRSGLAQAAYANTLFVLNQEANVSDNELLYRDAGMAKTQAAAFSETWGVAAQCSDASTGFSAVVFEHRQTGERCLAIRGTDEDEVADLFAGAILASGASAYFNPQFDALLTQVAQWQGDGTLGSTFSVSGHSLGGYLAVALKQALPQAVTEAYSFNAPGDGGLLGNIAQFFEAAFGVGVPVCDVYNVRSSSGTTVAAGLGY